MQGGRMSRLFDALVGRLLDGVSFFSNMSANRHDDPFVADHKALQRNLIRSFLWMLAMFGAFWGAGVFVNTLEGVFIGGALNGWRDVLSKALLVASAAAFAYVAYCSYALWHFERENGVG
jgi:hypothetical protein